MTSAAPTAAPRAAPPAPDADGDEAAADVAEVVVGGVRYAPLSWALAQAVKAGLVPGPFPEDYNGPGFPTGDPTAARPGTDAKIQVLAARYARREQLFHPRDAK